MIIENMYMVAVVAVWRHWIYTPLGVRENNFNIIVCKIYVNES